MFMAKFPNITVFNPAEADPPIDPSKAVAPIFVNYRTEVYYQN
jgi:hypothetical protein